MDLVFLGSVAIFAVIYIAAIWMWIKDDKKESLYRARLEKQLSKKEAVSLLRAFINFKASTAF